jgi:hypothetical protein
VLLDRESEMPLSAPALLRLSTWRPAVKAARILWFDYAHLKSAARGRPVDAQGNPVPWYTYPAIEYLRQLDFTDQSVFEYGSGQSTLFWAAKAARVVSVEDDEKWHATLISRLPGNCELILEPDLSAYPDVIHRYGEFDVIVVDGAARGRTRLKCSQAAVSHLRSGGLIILDNSDWLPASARFLRESGLLQVDMTGLVPGNANTQATSLFFRRDFVPRPRFDRLPSPGAGAADKNWEKLRTPEEPSVTIGGDTLGAVQTDRRVSFETADGRRLLRVIEGRAQGRRWSALADADRDRVILYLTEDEGADEISRAIDAAAADWHKVVAYVREHPRRRCLL